MTNRKYARSASPSKTRGLVESLEQRVLLSRALGLDVSVYQTSINWTSVAANKQFAIIRASYGVSSQDSYFSTNAPAAINSGMYVGFYHYAYYDYAGHTPALEAANYWNTVRPYMSASGKILMPMLDVEEGASTYSGSGLTLSQWVDQWCDIIKNDAAAIGLNVTPMIYVSAGHISSYFDSTVPQHATLNVADYISGSGYLTGQPPYGIALWPTWQFWQYTSSGSVPGISGNVDLDVFNGTAAQLTNNVVKALGTPPTATFATQLPVTGLGFFPFTIKYSDSIAVNISSFDSHDITVTGPNGYSQNAIFSGESPSGNGSPRTANYQINAPGGAWNILANGIYTVKINGNQVSNTSGQFVPAGTLGTFTVNEPFAYVYNNRLLINTTATSSSVSLSHSGNAWTVTNGANTYSFADSTFGSATFIGTSSNDTLNINSPLAIPLLYAGSSGQDTLNLNAGNMTFSSDLSATTPNLTLNLNNSAQALFTANQHLTGLNLMDNASAAMQAGGALTVETNSLSIGGTARLDLADDALVVNGGTNVNTVQGYLASGFGVGKWNGPGIDSSVAGGSGAYSVGYGLGSNLAYSSINGVSFGQSALVVRETFNGDANLDERVDADDMSLLMVAKSNQQSDPQMTAYWYNGDFTFDKKISSDDFMLFSLGAAVDQQILNPTTLS